MKLENLKFYIYEKRRLEEEIGILQAKLNYSVSSPKLGEVKSKSVKDTTFLLYVKNEKIYRLLQIRYKKVVKVIEEIYRIINSIEDVEIRQIVELRVLKNMTFEEIGEELHYSKNAVNYKYNNFMNSII